MNAFAVALSRIRARAGEDTSSYALVILGGLAFVGYEEFVARPALPPAIFLLGLVFGAVQALPALGLVLVFRTNRIINFAQGELGGFAAVLAAELLFLVHVPYYVAMATALVAAIGASMLIEVCVVRVFANTSRLILTVATIGVAQVLAAIQLITPTLWENKPVSQIFPQPFPGGFQLGVVGFGGAEILSLVLAPTIALGLWLFLRFTIIGAAIRASAEDVQRARALGVPSRRLSTLVWGIVGLVSALASLLTARLQGFTFGVLSGPGFMLRSLAPATIGRFDNLGLTFVAALVLGMVEQGFFYQSTDAGPVDVMLFLVIILALLARAPVAGRKALAETTTYKLLREVRPIPPALRRLPEVILLTRGVPVAALALLVALPFRLTQGQTGLMSSILIYAIVGISLVMLSGWGGQISLGHWALAGVGAFTAAQLFFYIHIDFFATIALAALAGAVVSVVIGLPAVRIGGYFLAVVTLAFAIAASGKFFILDPVQVPSFSVFGLRLGGFLFTPIRSPEVIPRPLLFGRFNAWNEQVFFYVVLAFFLLSWYLATNFRRGRLGRALVAMRDNEVAGTAYGLRPTAVKLITFALSGFLAALAGGLYAFSQGTAQVRTFGPEVSLFLFAIVVFGGLGSPAGATLGAVVVFGIQDFVGGNYALLATGAGILLMLMVAPGGVGQVMYDARDGILRWIARRRGIDVPALAGAEERPPPVIVGQAPAVT